MHILQKRGLQTYGFKLPEVNNEKRILSNMWKRRMEDISSPEMTREEENRLLIEQKKLEER